MAFSKITDADRLNKGVTGLSDTPNLETSEMQRKFDELANLSIDRFNNHIDEISANTGAANIGAAVPDGFTADNTVQSVLHAIARGTSDNTAISHTHTNKSVLDLITAAVKAGYDHVSTVFGRITSVTQSVTDSTQAVPTGHAVVNYVSRMGGGDMQKATYDINENGKVDVAEDAEKFGGELPTYYATKTELDGKLDGDSLDTDYDAVITVGSPTSAPADSVIKTLYTNVQAQLAQMSANFLVGCRKIANAITAQGVPTAENASPDTMATNIGILADQKYAAGQVVTYQQIGNTKKTTQAITDYITFPTVGRYVVVVVDAGSSGTDYSAGTLSAGANTTVTTISSFHTSSNMDANYPAFGSLATFVVDVAEANATVEVRYTSRSRSRIAMWRVLKLG